MAANSFCLVFGRPQDGSTELPASGARRHCHGDVTSAGALVAVGSTRLLHIPVRSCLFFQLPHVPPRGLLRSRCCLTSARCHVLGTYSARCCAGHSMGASSPVLVAPCAAHTSASRNKRLIPAASGGMFSERSKKHRCSSSGVFLNGNFVLFLLKALDGERVYLIVT